MERVPEPELMDDKEQASAYAKADFEEPHSRFINLFLENFGNSGLRSFVLDLGCGPGDITIRFARAFPDCIVHGVDGAEEMLIQGKRNLNCAPDVRDRIVLVHGILPEVVLPRARYDVVISNSLLHHLRDPAVLWEVIKRHAAPDAPIFIVDLARPRTPEEVWSIIAEYSGNELEILKRDFYNSLLAAFRAEEIEDQLKAARLEYLRVKRISDRHVMISGRYDADYGEKRHETAIS
jgi:SAM-dependent methyltransferase